MWASINQTLKGMFQSPSATIKCLECGKMLDENETEVFWKIASRQSGAEEEGRKSLSSCSSCKSKNLEMTMKWGEIEYRCSIDECSECSLLKVDVVNWEEVSEKRKGSLSKEDTIKGIMKNISELCKCEVMENNIEIIK